MFVSSFFLHLESMSLAATLFHFPTPDFVDPHYLFAFPLQRFVSGKQSRITPFLRRLLQPPTWLPSSVWRTFLKLAKPTDLPSPSASPSPLSSVVMREVISIHIGQGGVQIGNACWGTMLTLPTPLLTLLTLCSLENLLTPLTPLNLLTLPTTINLLNLPTFAPLSPSLP
jgi:hypothetical protein